jgi:hypothetical protein
MSNICICEHKTNKEREEEEEEVDIVSIRIEQSNFVFVHVDNIYHVDLPIDLIRYQRLRLGMDE